MGKHVCMGCGETFRSGLNWVNDKYCKGCWPGELARQSGSEPPPSSSQRAKKHSYTEYLSIVGMGVGGTVGFVWAFVHTDPRATTVGMGVGGTIGFDLVGGGFGAAKGVLVGALLGTAIGKIVDAVSKPKEAGSPPPPNRSAPPRV